MTINARILRPIAILCAVALSATACGVTIETDERDISNSDSSKSSERGSQNESSSTSENETRIEDFGLVEPEPDETAIAPNPAVRTGTLDNGMTYYVQSNSAPAGGLSLRLAVNAGSMQQEVADSGSAHFLEHMLFNGTENYPGNELTAALERLGVQFGADSNAYTSFDETVYQLDVPDADDAKTGTALKVMAEWASAAVITEEDTIAERSVVREEARLFLDGPGAKLTDATLHAYTNGTDYENRSPIGVEEKILATNADQLREYYDRWYRPDLMAIVAVGDAPVEELEAKIKQRFSSLTARGDNQERLEPTPNQTPEPVVDAIVDPSLPLSVGSVSFPVTNWGDETVGGERLSTIQMLNTAIITNRLLDAVDRGNVDIRPEAYVFPINRTQTFMDVSYQSSEIEDATIYVLNEISAAMASGFSDQETEQAIAELRVQLDQALAESNTTENPILSDDYVDHFLSGSEMSSMTATHERLTALLDELSAEDLTAIFRWDVGTSSPSVLVAGPDAAELPTKKNLEAALEAAVDGSGESTSDDVASDASIEELMTPPDAIEPISTTPIEGFDGTRWVFENGVTVNFVPSDTAAGQAELLAESEGGFGGMSREDGLLLPSAVSAVMESGAGDIDRSTYRRYLDRTTTQLHAGVSDTHQVFFGSTGSSDVETLLQRMHLAITTPRVDGVALRETIEYGETARSAVTLDAGFAASNGLASLLHGDDERFGYVPAETVNDLSIEKAVELFTSRFGKAGGLTVTIAGDLATEQVAELAARYLGTLPSGENDPMVDIRPEPLSKIVRRNLEVDGSEQAGGASALAYQSAVTVDDEVEVKLRVLDGILNDRLFATAREELGATYGGYVYSQAERTPNETITVSFEATGDPARGEEILTVMVEAAESLAADGPTADEFERAKAVVAADFSAELSNEELIGMVAANGEDRQRTKPLTPELRSDLLNEVDGDAIQELAAQIFSTTARAEVIVTPGN